LISFIKAQVKVENEIVDSLSSALVEMKNPPVKAVLRSISLDSVKHAEMYAAAGELLTTVSWALSHEDLGGQRALVEKHIRIEEELIEKIGKVLPVVEDEKVRLLLNAILSDEKRHHELLKMLLEIIVQKETITEEDLWDLLWKGVPFHGSPGG
jgi:rubrerythrin